MTEKFPIVARDNYPICGANARTGYRFPKDCSPTASKKYLFRNSFSPLKN